MSEYKIKKKEVVGKIKSTRRKENALILLSGLFNAISLVLSIIVIVSLIEFLARGDEAFRTVLAIAIIVVTGIAFTFYFFPGLLRSLGLKGLPSIETMALRIGDIFPDIKDKLCNALQLLKNADNNKTTSADLAYAAFSQVYDSSYDKDFDKVIEKRDLKRSLLVFFITGVISLGLMGFTLGKSFERVVNFNKSYLPPVPFSIKPEKDTIKVLRGEKVIIKIIGSGKTPDNLSLFLKEGEQKQFDEYIVRQDTNNNYNYEITSIKNSLIFYASANWLSQTIKTKECYVEVIDKPIIRSLNGSIVYPSYTKQPSQAITETNADVNALKGSVVNLNIVSNKEIAEGYIVLETKKNNLFAIDDTSISLVDTSYIKMNIKSNKAFGNIRVNNSGEYYIKIIDKEGLTNDDPIKYGISALTDDYPSINMISPLMNIRLTEDAILPMKVSISDDYGFSSLRLYYRVVASRYVPPQENFSYVNIPMLSKDLAMEVPYVWNLNKIGISPQDVFEYYIEVADNDIVSGPKTARTQSLAVRLPSLEEILLEAQEDQAKIENKLEEIQKNAEELKTKMEELNREMLKNQNKKELDWKEKKQAEDINKLKQEIDKKMKEVQKQLEDFNQSLQENKVLSDETVQKYMELQKLLQEVDSPELKMQQKRLEEALKQADPDKLKEAMENMKFNEEQFKKSIERTLSILKRLKAEQKTDALAKRAEELAKRQEELEKKLQNANPNDPQKRDDFAKEQKQIEKEMKDIAKELADLEKLMQEIGSEMPMDEMKKAKESLNEKQLQNQMQNSSQMCQSGNFSQARQQQQKSAQNLKDFAKQMQKMKQEMENRLSKEALRQMQKAMNDMLELSKKQEALKNKGNDLGTNSTQIPQMSIEQGALYDMLAGVANSMMQLSQKSFAVTPAMAQQLGNALQQMRQAANQLAEQNLSRASNAQSSAQQSLNQAVGQMQSMLNSMQNPQCNNPGAGSGQGEGQGQGQSMMQRLQQLASEQQAINQAMQQMAAGGGQLSQEQQSELGRIAGKQGKAQKTMEELAAEQKQFSSEGKKAGLGSFDKIAEEMKQVQRDMEQGRINPETLERQERILSRLLDATQSVHKRDVEEKREGKTGKEYTRESPKEINLRLQEGKTMQDILKTIQQNYTKDYEILIRKYFEALQSDTINEQ